MAYYNTNGIAAGSLKEARKRVNKQQQEIYNLFVHMPTALLTPFQVQQEMQVRGFDWPITSVRRAMTDLTGMGKLQKSFFQFIGAYGKPNHAWKLNAHNKVKTRPTVKQKRKPVPVANKINKTLMDLV